MRLSLIRTTLAACFIGLAAAAQAATMSVVPDGAGNFTIVDTTGPHAPEYFDMNIQPTTQPNPVIFFDQNPTGGQSPSNVATLIGASYGIDPDILKYVGGCDSIPGTCGGLTTTSTTFALSGVPAFDYLAIHMGGGELFFHWSQPITSMLLTAFDGFPGGISNYRTYLTTPVPGAFILFLSALGLLGLRRKVAEPADAEPAPA